MSRKRKKQRRINQAFRSLEILIGGGVASSVTESGILASRSDSVVSADTAVARGTDRPSHIKT